MKIAIDVTYTPSGGSLTQILHMIKIFNQLDEVDVVVYSKSSNNIILSDAACNNKVVLSKLSNLSTVTRIFWGQFFLPFYLRKEKVDVLFCPGNISPIYSPIKTVVWIGTIGPFFKDFYTNFSWTDKVKLYVNKFFMIASSKAADAVIFESQFTEKLFIEKYHMQIGGSHVINIGFDAYFSNKEVTNFDDVDVKFASNAKYILCVSHLYPYKNIIRLLLAYKMVINNNASRKLVIAGSRDYIRYNDEIEKCITDLNMQNNVILLGNVSKRYLKYLYLNSYMLIFPSPFENFAYTLVEAMSCGTPIICSNTTAMPETCQDAALYFDPYNTDDMAEKMDLIMKDDILRQKMSEKSIIRSKELPDYKEVTLRTLDIMKGLISEQNKH